MKSSHVTDGDKQSTDPWQAWVDGATEQFMEGILEQTKADPMSLEELSALRVDLRTDFETQAQEWKKHGFTEPPSSIPELVKFERGRAATTIEPEKYTGPQTVEAVMEAFDEIYSRHNAEAKLDERYPRAQWLAMFLGKGCMVGDYIDYTRYMNERLNLVNFEENGDWVAGLQGVPPTDDWETFKAAYIDRKAWEHQQIDAARQIDPNVFGGLFTGPDNRTYLPGRANRVYVERKGRGAFFHGAPLTEKQQWDIMLQGKHPEGYEIIYIDENGTILSEPPPPIPPPTGEERRQLETWLRRGKSQPPETSADASSQTSEDWDIGRQDSPLEDETVSAAAQATQKRFEQAQTEALERATKSDVEIDAELEKLLTPEPTTPFDPEAWKGLSPERRKRAKQFFDQYGTEEGLRRLRASDPEAAEQFDRERNNPPGRDEPPVKDEKATPSTQ